MPTFRGGTGTWPPSVQGYKGEQQATGLEISDSRVDSPSCRSKRDRGSQPLTGSRDESPGRQGDERKKDVNIQGTEVLLVYLLYLPHIHTLFLLVRCDPQA